MVTCSLSLLEWEKAGDAVNWFDPTAEELATRSVDLIRSWRGARTQLELSIELGFNSNVVTHWESGRRFPRASVALRAAALDQPGLLDSLARLAGADWSARVSPDSPTGVSLLVADLMAGCEIPEVASRLGVSPQTLYRWLAGRAEPRLPEFLGCVAAGLRLELVLELLTPENQPDPEPLWVSDLLLALYLDAYRALPAHDDSWLAGHLYLPPSQVEEGIERLARTGQIVRLGQHWKPAENQVASWTFQSTAVSDGARARAASLLAEPTTRFVVVSGMASAAQIGRVMGVARRAHEDIVRIFANTDHTERLVHVCLALTPLDGELIG